MTRRSTVLLVAVAILAGAPWAAAGGAQAEPGHVDGGGFALSIAAGGAPLVAATPAGVVGSGAGRFTPVAASVDVVDVPGVVSAARLTASTDGRPSDAGDASVTSTASVGAVSIAGGLVTIGAVSSSCTSTAAGSTGSATIDALTVAGTSIPVPSGANTVVDVPGLVHAVLDEQVPAGPPSLTVRAVHLQVHLTDGGPQLLDVVVAESRCAVGPPSVTPSTVAPPTTTVTPRPTLAPRPTVPPTTVPPTTVAPVRTTLAQPAVGPPPPPPPPGGGGAGAGPAVSQAVRAAAGGDQAAGAAGADLDVTATGFQGCSAVRILFDGTRIGTAHPDPSGSATADGLAVPGGAPTGSHLVAATCEGGARLLRATAPFRVEPAAVHRSAFATALAEPRQVGTTARSILLSVVGALGLLLAVAFPSELFNSTLDENYDEVRGWFGLKPATDRDAPAGGRQALAFVAFVLLGGLLYGFLSPDLAFDRSSVALVLGLSLSLVVISVAFRLPHLIYLHHEDREWARFRVLPGTALVAVACVALSRAVHFQPGYLYGLIAGLSFRRRLATDTNGALTAASAVSVFLLSLLAWVARVPVSAAAARPHASIWTVALEACLAAVTILGLETVVICLIPLRFVEGAKLAAWSRTAWAAVFALCAFAFVHILLRPDSGYVAASSSRWTVVALFVGFGLLSVGFWAYFRFRPARPSRAPQAERQPELVG